jgi:hypothetical protein
MVAAAHVAGSGYHGEARVDDDELGYEPLADDAIAEARRKLQAALEPRGLWDPERFGLWTVLVCSY